MNKFKEIAIVGAGLLGHGIAVAHAIAGCQVRLFDISTAALEAAKVHVDAALNTLVEGAVLTDLQAGQARARMRYIDALPEALREADLVVESVSEDIRVKEAVYQEIATFAPAHAILASNTSYLDVFPVVPMAMQHRCFIIHWYTPPYIVDLVDVIPGPEVNAALCDEVYQFIETGLGKKPVRLKKFVPGYIANRIQMAIESEAFRLLDSGVADVADIDRSISQGLGLRLALFGQFRKIDFTGLKIVRDSHRLEIYEPPKLPTVSRVLESLVEEGRGGVLTGAGFYDYEGADAKGLLRQRDLNLLALKRSLKRLHDENGDGD